MMTMINEYDDEDDDDEKHPRKHDARLRSSYRRQPGRPPPTPTDHPARWNEHMRGAPWGLRCAPKTREGIDDGTEYGTNDTVGA